MIGKLKESCKERTKDAQYAFHTNSSIVNILPHLFYHVSVNIYVYLSIIHHVSTYMCFLSVFSCIASLLVENSRNLLF